jgi:rhodanese-related sulfurtransferase
VLILQHAGVTNASALRGGLREWIERGYPTASGSE